jgi:phosphinothricin acetyltransferase
MTPHRTVSCTHARHAQAILDIFNEAIAHSTALYDYHPRPLASMGPWFEAKNKGHFPVVDLEDEAGMLPQVGFKFGHWLDLAFYQRLLDTLLNPS